MKLTERQLSQIIRESIEENCTEEGFLGNMFSGLRNAGGQAGRAMGNAASNQWNKVKNTAYNAGQRVAQGANSMRSAYNAGAAQNAQKDVQAQIEKSQQIINREQQKINQLRGKMNGYIQNSNKYAQMANQNAANRGEEGNYQGSNMKQDNRTRDFYNQKQKNGAIGNYAKKQKAKQNSQQMPVALEESKLDRIVKEAIDEIKAQTVQDAINNRYDRIRDKENNNEFYRDNNMGDIDRARTRDQVYRIQNTYNDLYCQPTPNSTSKPDEFSVRFGHGGTAQTGYGTGIKQDYSMHGGAFKSNADSDRLKYLGNNPKYRNWKRENGF